jgi:sarcosine oxidase gamma subunit
LSDALKATLTNEICNQRRLSVVSISAESGNSKQHDYLNATEPQFLTEVQMKTKVEKLGPGSWAVFVNGQRHHELFLTRAAARKEAKRQNEANKIGNES